MESREKNVFITGVSSGLGYGLAQVYLEIGWNVFGVSRRTPSVLLEHPKFRFKSVDLHNFEELPDELSALWKDCPKFEVVLLNAGILGGIRDLKDVQLNELKEVMDVNLWSNKIVMDCLCNSGISIDQVIAISSGASVNGNRGWSGYSLSKAALNMLIKLYACELPHIHFVSLAPGLIDTAMQDYLHKNVDESKFTSIKRINDSRNTPSMPSPIEAANKIIPIIPTLKQHESGSFLDIRKL